MASVVTENIILLIPTFFAMMIFTLVTNAVVGNYSMQQQLIVIDSAQNQVITIISQLYFSVNQPEIESCVVTKILALPEQIDGQNYNIAGSLENNILTLTFDFPGIPLSDSITVHLGPEAEWDESSTFSSINPSSILMIEKYFNAAAGSYKIKLGFR